jgi:hypothetical protein
VYKHADILNKAAERFSVFPNWNMLFPSLSLTTSNFAPAEMITNLPMDEKNGFWKTFR